MEPRIPAELVPLCQALVEGQRRSLGNTLFGMYVYGAIAFPEAGATGDIDFHAILASPPDTPQKEALKALHDRLAQDFPPMGAELDGWYILLEEAIHAAHPEHQLWPELHDRSWALHRAHLRAGRCFVLHGSTPGEFLPAPSWLELESALQAELEYVTAHLTDAPDYCVLNLCRLMYSYKTHDVVVSKRASAAWATGALPVWRPLVEAALRSYDKGALDQELSPARVASFFAFACAKISAASAR